jgi:arylsulfatase A-like enzyme
MRRLLLLLGASLIAAASCYYLFCVREAPPRRPAAAPTVRSGIVPANLLFISVDTLRADHLGFHGYQRDTSPFLDRFARESIVFRDASVQVPKTTPSMASMMTSLYPEQAGVMANLHVLRRSRRTLAEELQERGFHTVAHTTNLLLNDRRGIDQGFEEFTSTSPTSAEELTDWAIARLDAGFAGRFFMWIHYTDPHGPYDPPPPNHLAFVDDEHYDPKRKVVLEYERIPGFDPNLILGAVPIYQQEHLKDHERRTERDFYIAQYDGEIRYLDQHLGRLFAHLERTELLASTMVVFTADHGEGLGEHEYYFEHGWFVYQDQLHVPWLIRLPGQAPQSIETPVQLLDLAPTLVDFLGLPRTGHFRGKSLVPLVESRGMRPAPIYAVTPAEYPGQSYRGLRVGRIKYIVDHDAREELYDLVTDPRETSNLAAERPEQLAEFREWLADGSWRAGAPEEPIELPLEDAGPEELEQLRALGYVE